MFQKYKNKHVVVDNNLDGFFNWFYGFASMFHSNIKIMYQVKQMACIHKDCIKFQAASQML